MWMKKSIPQKMCQKEALYSMILSKNVENLMNFFLFTFFRFLSFSTKNSSSKPAFIDLYENSQGYVYFIPYVY